MELKKKYKEIIPRNISQLLLTDFSHLMGEFYEMQSSFLITRYKFHNSLETASIINSLITCVHLSIVRQRERYLDHDLSLKNFFLNLENLPDRNTTALKIVQIVNSTSIPKETVRRKLKKCGEQGFVSTNKYKEYYWVINDSRKDSFVTIMKKDIKALTRFTFNVSNLLNLNLNSKLIENEIELNFSFYFYHFLSCQISWLKMWQNKIKDIDLILITLQAIIPAMQFSDKNQNIKDLGLDNLHTLLGKTNKAYEISDASISAASISEITGIPRATCIRKLDTLVNLEMLIRDNKTKRYFLNQSTSGRTKNIMTKNNVSLTINIFADFLSIILNALIRKK